jgi:hypothetical protein
MGTWGGCQEFSSYWFFGELELEEEIILLRQFYSEISWTVTRQLNTIEHIPHMSQFYANYDLVIYKC